MTLPSSAQPASTTPLGFDGRSSRSLRWLLTLPARCLLGLIWLYQRALSPVLPVVLGPSFGCRFAPTCSRYAAEAVQVHGAAFGTLLAIRRLLKCTPLHPGGMDAVPPRAQPRCTRVTPTGGTLTSSHSTA